MSNPVGWFEIYVEDMDRATAFYQTVLAVELTLLTDPTEEQVHMMAFPSDMEKIRCRWCAGKNGGYGAWWQ